MNTITIKAKTKQVVRRMKPGTVFDFTGEYHMTVSSLDYNKSLERGITTGTVDLITGRYQQIGNWAEAEGIAFPAGSEVIIRVNE